MMQPTAKAFEERIEALLDALERAMQTRDRVESQVRIRPTPESRKRLRVCKKRVRFLERLWDCHQCVLELLLQLEESPCDNSSSLETQLKQQLEKLERLETQRPVKSKRYRRRIAS